jgi:hypothetical protein
MDAIKERMLEYAEKQHDKYTKGFNGYFDRYVKLRDQAFKEALRKKRTSEDELAIYMNNIQSIMEAYENGTLLDIPKVIIDANIFEAEVLAKELGGDELKEFREVKSIVKYVSLKIQGEVLARVVMRTRIDLAKDLARAVDYKKYLTFSKKKLLMFSAYGEVCEVAHEECSKHGKTLRLYWEYTTELANTIKEFFTNPKAIALVGTYKSISTGVEIQAADISIFFDLPFRTLTYEQAQARTSRYGQDVSCYYVQLLLDTGNEDNINSRNIDIIAMSKEVVEYITDREIDVEFKRLEVVEGFLDGDMDVLGFKHYFDGTGVSKLRKSISKIAKFFKR